MVVSATFFWGAVRMASLTPDDVSGLLPHPGGPHGEDVAGQLQANYDELRRLAAAILQAERSNHTLQPTALVHETYLRLVAQRNHGSYTWAEFVVAASTVMRRILVDYARFRQASKRGGGTRPSRLDQALCGYEDRAGDLVALDDALERLGAVNPRLSRIVELRFFGGMTMPEIAEQLGTPLRTVERGWTMAKAWLISALGPD